ncbi:MAG: ABC transporter ATP-binding protein [Candidatus Hodarchaeota archaeon]
MVDTLLDCKDLIKIYESESKIKVPALRGIDLTIKEGELLAIIGPSGAGKSTFIRLVGMIEQLSSGEIIYNGPQGQIKYSKATFSDMIRFRREICGYLFQLPEKNLLYNLNALQNIMIPMKIVNKLSHEEQKKRAQELLTLLGLEKRIFLSPAKLSGGEAQRLGICIALANNPPLILADEPTGELDSLNTQKIIRYFRELNQNLGKTIIVVTHDRRFSKMTDVIYRIQDGKITTMYLPSNRDRKGREKIIYVSKIGELTIPHDLREEYLIRRLVKVIRKETHIRIMAEENTSQMSSSESEEWVEYAYVSDDGRVILPTQLRKELGIERKVKFIAENSYIKVVPVN